MKRQLPWLIAMPLAVVGTLAGHSAGGLYVLNFARLYPDDVAGVALLDSMSPQQYTAIDGWPEFYEVFRRASAVMPALSRLGLGQAMYSSAYGDLRNQAQIKAP